MRSAIISVVLGLLATQVLSSPLEQATTPAPTPTPTPAPTCTLTILKQAPFKKYCTNFGKTLTSTHYTECGGCALVTKRLGLGLPCRAVTYNPGNTGEVVTSCRPKTTPAEAKTTITQTKTTTFVVRPTVTPMLKE